MPLFRCLIRGENFPGTLIDEDGPIGFFTTRFVQAESADEAELLAIDVLRSDASLAVAPEHRGTEAMVYFEEIEEVADDAEQVPNAGFSFFPMGS